MAEEAPMPQATSPISEDDPSFAISEQSQHTNEATIQTATPACSESSVKDAGSSVTSSGFDIQKPLELSDELTEKGSVALKDRDFAEATECFSRALEIRVAHYGELAPECVDAYYKYGCALLYKAQEEADPLATMPKKDAGSQKDSDKDVSAKIDVRGESSIASVSSDAEQDKSAKEPEGAVDDCSGEKNEGDDHDDEDEDEESDADDLGEADEDESDLDLAWKMLDLARAIAEKQSSDTMQKVDILSALAEVALEREDIETSLSDYLKALSILERIVEPDHRYVAELNFRICLCLEFGSKAQEAIPYCQKAISVCKTRMQRLIDEMKSSCGSKSSSVSEVNCDLNHSSLSSLSGNSGSDKQEEIDTLSDLAGELEKKLEDLQQLVSNPTSILSDILGMMMTKQKAKGGENPAPSASASSSRIAAVNSNGGFNSPTMSTGHTNGTPGVTHLGVVGRGVKRVVTTSASVDMESSPAKRPATDSKEEDKSS
ncbi:hypothetical protein Dimus_014339 [Dionaea muscipula]